jgi:signal transduction histidine kinase
VFLADASAVLSVRLERLATIEGLARVAVPAFADFCAIDLVDEGSRHVAARIVHADPAVVARARQLRRTHPFDPSAPGGVAAIIRTGRVEAALDGWPGARRAEDDPWVNGLLPVLPVRASIAAPVATPDGRRLGVITLLVSDPTRRFTDEDVETARDLGRRAGIAIDHAALFSAVNARSDELTAVIDAIADPVVIADPDGSIRSYNPAAEPILDAADEPTFDAVLAALRPGPARRDVAQVGTSPRYVQPVVLEVQGEDGPSRVAILRDVTELLESEAARDAFLGMLSHELRTPITTIFGGSRMLLKPLDEEVRQSLTLDLAEETDRLYRLVEDLLVLSRFERGRLEIAPEPVLVQRVLSQVLAREGERLPGLRIATRVQSSLPPALADPTYIEQIVRNLIGNAAKYAGRTAAIEVRAWVADGQIHVELEDDGPGVPEADRERVFALYERLSERRDPMTPGAGIGLFVCRRLVEAMHGRISVRRGDRGGACFTFTLPAMAAGEGRDAA